MNLLHLLPPETAHQLSLWALKNGFGPAAAPDDPALRRMLFGKTLSNPIGLSGGAEKKAEALPGWARMGFGFVEAGTVTLHPRAGNPKPRIWRLKDGKSIVNWLGLPGDGLDPFAANLRAFQTTPERATLILGASLASPDGVLDEFRKLSAACAPLVDYLTLNASCPNVRHGESANPAQAAQDQIKAVVAEAGNRPVLLKLGPTRDAAALKIMVDGAIAAGAAGIVATNTMPYDKRDLLGAPGFDWPVHNGQPVGGYSGPVLLDTACWMVRETRALVGKNAPVIGVGGVQSGADALRLMQAGADAIQLYTGLIYKGPGLLNEIKQALIVSQNGTR